MEGLFEPASKKWRIYRRIGPTRHDIVDFPLIPAGACRGQGVDRTRILGAGRHRAVRRTLLERFAPASVLIDRHFTAIRSMGRRGTISNSRRGSRPAT